MNRVDSSVESVGLVLISTKTQLQTISMQFPSHVGEGQGGGQ